VYWKSNLIAATSPVFAFLISSSAISSKSLAVARFSRVWRSAATCRANGLPGPPLLPLAKRPFASRLSVDCCVVWSSARTVVVLMAGSLLQLVVVQFGGADIPVCGQLQQTGMSAPPNRTTPQLFRIIRSAREEARIITVKLARVYKCALRFGEISLRKKTGNFRRGKRAADSV